MVSEVVAQEPNYDESKIVPYELPAILKCHDGTPVTSVRDWKRRRSEIVDLFSNHVYGSMPAADKVSLKAKVLNEFDVELTVPNDRALPARAREVEIRIRKAAKSLPIRLLIFLPRRKQSGNRPCPVFMAYNFGGNHTVHPSTEIQLATTWTTDPENRKMRVPSIARAADRGKRSGRWTIDEAIGKGIGLVTLYYGDVDPDFDDGFKNGIHALFPEMQNRSDNWASIGAWAWGLHRVMDYLETVPDIDHENVAVLGHSRLGKTALWTGATDERFKVVISNNSGCGGAALSRRRIGETIARINKVFPHWFCQRHQEYDHREGDLPVDQHMLLASIAPRAVYVASAEGDRWADPRGEFLSTFHASPTWKLFDLAGLARESDKMPDVDRPVVGEQMGYHVRTGNHDVKRFDWQRFVEFAKRHF